MQADVVDAQSGTEQTTNDFKFTWCEMEGAPLQRVVVPQTYAGEKPIPLSPLVLALKGLRRGNGVD